MSDRRDISDIVRTADAQRTEQPHSQVWARIAERLGPDDVDTPSDSPSPPSLNGHAAATSRPTRSQLMRRARGEQLRRPPQRRSLRTAWLAAAAAVVGLVMVYTFSAPAPTSDVAQDPQLLPEPTEQLDLAPRPARAVADELYEGVDIHEGTLGVDELRVCSPC